jgi:hypothetical protein
MDALDSAYDPDPLGVGTRVRVRLSGECRRAYARSACGPAVVFEHYTVEHGRTGTVHSSYPHVLDGHAYVVSMDVGWAMMYARAELERA